MKAVKMILFFILLGLTLYTSHVFICVHYGTGPSYDWSIPVYALYWCIYAVLFILSDLWLHHRKARLIALGVLALVYLLSFEYYLFCEEYGYLIFQYTDKIILPYSSSFSFYWSLQGSLAGYLLLAMGVSHLLKKKRTFNNVG